MTCCMATPDAPGYSMASLRMNVGSFMGRV